MSEHYARTARRQRLVAHLYAAGPRPVLEAMIEVATGEPLDDVLERYARIPVAAYHEIGANALPPINFFVIDGDRP
jgi:hypothetical protein